MREGGYVRYDGRKSTQLIRDCEKLLHDYRGSLKRLHEQATDTADLERRVADFYGIAPELKINTTRRAKACSR